MAGNATRSEANQSFFIFIKDTNTGIIRRMAIPADVQIGLEGRPAELQLLGRLSVSSTMIVVNSSNKGIINISNDNTVNAILLSAEPSGGRVKVYLPPTPREGQLHFIKDASGTAGRTPIDIIPPTGIFIDDDVLQTLSDVYGSQAFIWLSGQWRRLVAGTGSSVAPADAAPAGASYVTINSESTLTSERHLTSSANLVMTDNGVNASVFLDLTPVLGGGAGTFAIPTLTVDAWGRITSISAGSAGASPASSFITVSNEPSLSAERALVAGNGLQSSDGGANSNFTLQINDNVVATVSGTRFTGPVIASTGLSGSLQQLSTNISYLVAGSNVTITSQSNGQVIISSSGSSSNNSLPVINNLTIIAGNQTVDQSVFQAIGAFEFNPTGAETMAPSGSNSYTAYFQPIVEVFPTGVTLETQLYNVGLNSYVASSLLSCSQLGATRLRSLNLTGSLIDGSNTYEMHMRITNERAGKAICKGAKLFVTWT